MFFKALFFSIILHLLLLSWAGANLPSSAPHTPTSSTALAPRAITLIEPSLIKQLIGDPPAAPVASPEPLMLAKNQSPVGRSKVQKRRLPGVDKNPPPFLAPMGNTEEKPITPATKERAEPELEPEAEAELKTVSTLQGDAGSEVLFLAKAPTEDVGYEPDQDEPTVSSLISEPLSEDAPGFTGLLIKEEPPPLPTIPEQKVEPVKIFHVNPVYPQRARRNGWEGTVFLQALINKEGTVTETLITTSSGYKALDQAALEAVRQWKYQWPSSPPESIAEKWISIKISFKLEGS